jgi:NADH-ubiquinone oxidoreductase chain 5
MMVFMRIMVLFLVGMDVLYLIGWEGIGIMSYLLIGYWIRSEGVRSAVAAVLYNRLGDVGLICLFLAMDNMIVWYMVMVAIVGKSALWVWRYWLPIAMEGPTPVSSLLHSSTMVVAGVVLRMVMFEGGLSIGLISLVIISIILPSWYDGKKIIALSTSVHLSVIMSMIGLELWRLVIIHIVTHGLIKASAFVNCGHVLHECRTQDGRKWSNNVNTMVMGWGFLILCRIRGSVVMLTKEQIVIMILGVFVIMIRWIYTKNFVNVNDGIQKSSLMSNFWYLLVILGRSSWIGVDPLMMILMVACVRIVSFNVIRVVNN